MPFTVDIIDQKQFFLFSEVESTIVDEGDDDYYPTLTFVTKNGPREDSFDNEIYSLKNIDIIYCLVHEELLSMGVSHKYKALKDVDIDEIYMDTIYVTKEENTKTVMNTKEIKFYKMTQITVNIKKVKRKRGSNVKNAKNEPPCKKNKLTE